MKGKNRQAAVAGSVVKISTVKIFDARREIDGTDRLWIGAVGGKTEASFLNQLFGAYA